MQVKPEVQQQIRAWREQESKYYAAALSEAELYMVGIQLVRAIANNLRTIDDIEELVGYYRGLDVQYVLPIADALDTPLAVFLDYASALGAAFYVRTQEIREEKIQQQARERILAASRANQQWVTLYHDETLRNGITFFWHLEMNLRNGIGLQTACELDFQKGRVYVLELLVLNPETGRVCRDIKLPDSKQEFRTQDELTAAIADLRQKHVATEVNHGSCL
ncbi:MAG: hypothetical protein L0154_03700 [Chloroflexi bacterium]|nr:hypothetical protein [Chloroflexota bacterium]